MKKINLAISGCLGRMGQQLIKSSKKNKNFKLVTLTENSSVNRKFNRIKPELNSDKAFKKSDVIIVDEATSAVDEKTENSVMKEIYKIDKKITIIMVSHRLSTMRNCDLIYELDQGQVKWSGTYAELVTRKS